MYSLYTPVDIVVTFCLNNKIIWISYLNLFIFYKNTMEKQKT